MANAAPTRAMAPMQIFVARVVAPEVPVTVEPVDVSVDVDSVTVEPVDVSVDVDVDEDEDVDDVEDSSVLLMLIRQGLASLISAWLHSRSSGGNRKVTSPSPSMSTSQPEHIMPISQPGHFDAL